MYHTLCIFLLDIKIFRCLKKETSNNTDLFLFSTLGLEGQTVWRTLPRKWQCRADHATGSGEAASCQLWQIPVPPPQKISLILMRGNLIRTDITLDLSGREDTFGLLTGEASSSAVPILTCGIEMWALCYDIGIFPGSKIKNPPLKQYNSSNRIRSKWSKRKLN